MAPGSSYGALDLSQLKKPETSPEPPKAVNSPKTAETSVDAETIRQACITPVDSSGFEALSATSHKLPVLVYFWMPGHEPCAQLQAVFDELIVEYQGRVLLATVDVEKAPEVAGALQVQSVPAVLVILAGRVMPLFEGPYPMDQVRIAVGELFKVAEKMNITGNMLDEATGEEGQAPAAPELPPLHQEAQQAYANGDLAGAIAAYQRALKQNPQDQPAAVGLVLMELQERNLGKDPVATIEHANQASSTDPDYLAGQLAAADAELLINQPAAALRRLLDMISKHRGEERAEVQARIVSAFTLLGEHSAVPPARRQLATLLF